MSREHVVCGTCISNEIQLESSDRRRKGESKLGNGSDLAWGHFRKCRCSWRGWGEEVEPRFLLRNKRRWKQKQSFHYYRIQIEITQSRPCWRRWRRVYLTKLLWKIRKIPKRTIGRTLGVAFALWLSPMTSLPFTFTDHNCPQQEWCLILTPNLVNIFTELTRQNSKFLTRQNSN